MLSAAIAENDITRPDLLLWPTPALCPAQLDQRQDQQMQRILNGMESGKLTLREAVGLLRKHLAIANLERSYMADGRLGPNELVSLEQRPAEAERHITFEQRDREEAPPVGRPGDMGRPGGYDRR
ncbi:MAG: hypothetical protein WBX11_12375 [Thiobacillaceae bacterium]